MGIWQRVKGILGRGPVVGVDLGSDSVKAVILEVAKEFSVKDLFLIPVERGVLEEGVVKNEDALVMLLSGFKRSIPPRSKVVAVLPSVSSFIASFKLGESGENPDSALRRKISEKLPVSLDELSYDYFFDKASKHVVSVMSRRHSVGEIVRVYSRAGIELEAVTSTYSALCNAYLMNYDGEGCNIIVDVGYTITTFCLIRDGKIYHGQSFLAGTKLVEDLIAASYQHNGVRVRKLMNEESLNLKDDIVKDAVGRLAKLISDEIFSYEAACKKGSYLDGGETIKFYISGGGSCLPGFLEALSSRLPERFEVVRLDPFRRVLLNQDIEASVQNLKPLYAVALGAGGSV